MRGLTRADWDVTLPPPDGLSAGLVLHTAAWTDVDGAEDDPQSAATVNVGGVQHAAELGASTNFVRTMLRLGADRDEVAVVDDQRGCPTYVGHLAEATKQVLELPYGIYHVAADGDCTWADFAEAIFEEAGLPTRVRRITTADYGAKAPRPAYSVLRSERGAPELPHWRVGLRECLARLGR